MRTKILCVIIFSFIFINFTADAQLFGFPKPYSTNLLNKTNQNFSGSNFKMRQYQSTLSQTEILAFYNNKLSRMGWKKRESVMANSPVFSSLGVSMKGRVFNYIKGNELLVLSFSPFVAEGSVIYTVSIGKMPQAGDNNILEKYQNMFQKPQKIDFFPAYPGAKQVHYNKNPNGVQAGYMVSDGLDAAKDFYLQKMPQYGWTFDSEKTLQEAANSQTSGAACPTCPGGVATGPSYGSDGAGQVNLDGVILEFSQGEKFCFISIIEMAGIGGAQAGNFSSLGLGSTMVTVVYNEKR